jgi:hypothetical protein
LPVVHDGVIHPPGGVNNSFDKELPSFSHTQEIWGHMYFGILLHEHASDAEMSKADPWDEGGLWLQHVKAKYLP